MWLGAWVDGLLGEDADDDDDDVDDDADDDNNICNNLLSLMRSSVNRFRQS